MFGRKLYKLKTIVANPSNFKSLISTHPIKSIITVNNKTKLLLAYNNLDLKLMSKLNVELHLKMYAKTSLVKSNVAIASAITSYARIKMMEFKNIDDVDILYTDTDSIIVNKSLPSHLIGNELGLMKVELNGGLIKKAYFFGIKKYAFVDNNDELKTVFSGVGRNT